MLARNDFANAVIGRLRQLGAKVLPRYDELSFCFFVDVSAAAATGKKGYLRLEQWYDRYQEALLDGRGEQALDDLARFWMQLLANGESRCMLDTTRMLPLVRSRFDIAATELLAGAAGNEGVAAHLDQLAFRPLGDHLIVALAEDSANAWRHIHRDELAQAGLTWETALPVAMKNLRRAEPAFEQPVPFVRSEGNTWVPATRQSPHTAAALLFPQLCRNLPVAGQRVAFVPFETTLAITGSENYAELARLAAMTLTLCQTRNERPLCAIPLVLEGNDWRPWLPPQTHSVFAAIRELWLFHENSLYAEQSKLLKQKLEGTDDAPYIASYKVMVQSSPSGQRTCSTLTMWTETLSTLLPRADAVVLTRLLNRAELDANEHAEPKLGERITVGWAELSKHLGHNLKPQGMYPERYLVRGESFPTGRDWDVMAQAKGITPAAVAAAPPAHAGFAGNPVGISAPTPSGTAPVAPAHRSPLWPILLILAIPIAFFSLLVIGVSLFVFFHWSPRRPSPSTPLADTEVPSDFPVPLPVIDQPPAKVGGTFPASLRPAAPPPPPYTIALPWTEPQAFPPIGKPDVPLPRASIDKQDLLPSGGTLDEGLDEFREEVPPGGWLVGLRLARGFNWGGAIRAVQPIYQVEDQYRLGKWCGSTGGAAQMQALARPGYAVGRIEARAGLVNNALRLTYFKVKEQGLDAADSYATEWLGSEGGGEVPTIGGRGELIVGLAGTYRRGDDVVGLQGLVTMPLPKVEQPLPQSARTSRNGASTDQRQVAGFSDQAPPGGWLVGLRVFQGESWGGAPVAIQPIYQMEDKYILGGRLGKEGGTLHQWIAPPGYAVGEILADQGLVVHRLQLRFQKIVDGSLDVTESKDSPRLGPEGGQAHRLSSEGKPIVGLNAELVGDIRSLGLIVAE